MTSGTGLTDIRRSARTADQLAAVSISPSGASDMILDVALEAAATLVGRDDETTRLAALLGIVEAGGDQAGGMVLLSGDAGIGKTRVIAEIAGRARRQRWTVLVGHCLGEAGQSMPYLPFIEMLGRLSAEQPDTMQRLLQAHTQLAGLLPHRRLRPDSLVDEDAEHFDRADLVEATHGAFEDLAADGPVLLVVEDVHWADQSSRDLLTLLFTRGFAGPVSIVATYRSDDLHRRHPLRATLAHWSRLTDVRRLDLEPLGDVAVRQLVTDVQTRPLSPRQVNAVVERAEGNAFFAEELVAASALDGPGLAEDLSRLLLVRFDTLGASGQAVVRLASVAGRQVSHRLLAAATDLAPAELDQGLRDAVERHVLVATDAGGYAFRHALLAEAVYDDLLPGERVRSHERYAAVLAQDMTLGSWADLARHADAAGDHEQALRASVKAGDDAMSVGGPQEAWQQYQRAISLLADDHPDADAVVLGAAEAASGTGRLIKAVKLLRERLDRRPSDADPRGRAELLSGLAGVARMTDEDVDGFAVTTEGLALLDPGNREHDATRARLLAARVQALSDLRRDQEAADLAPDAIAAADRAGLAGLAGDTRLALARGLERAGDLEGSRRSIEEVIAGARAADDPARVRALYTLASLHHRAGRLQAAMSAYQQALDAAGRTRGIWGPYALDARLLAGIAAYEAGQWDQSLALLDCTGEGAPQPGAAMLASAALYVAAGRGDATGLDQVAPLRQWWAQDAMVAVISGTAAIDLHGNAGDLDATVAAHDDLVEFLSRVWQPEFQARVRLVALLLGQLATQVQRVPTSERGALLESGAKAARDAAWVIERKFQGYERGPEAVAWSARMRAEDLRLRWLGGDQVGADELVDAWRETTAAFAAYGHPYETARSQVRLAAALQAVGDPEARLLLRSALETAHRLGAEPLLAEIRATGGARVAASLSHAGEALTPREREILALLALGRSNGQIGSQLFISTKTASVHVSNIIAKLGVRTRGEAVAVARDQGLLD